MKLYALTDRQRDMIVEAIRDLPQENWMRPVLDALSAPKQIIPTKQSNVKPRNKRAALTQEKQT